MKFFLKKLTLVAVFGLFALSGCLKNDIEIDNSPKSWILLAHMAVTAPAAEIYINNTLATNKVEKNTMFNYYNPILSGNLSFSFKKADSDSVIASSEVVRLDSAKIYTIYSYSLPDSTAAVGVMEDKFDGITVSNTGIRFIHLSPDVEFVDVYLNDEKIFGFRELGDNLFIPESYAIYKTIAPTTYTVRVVDSQTEEELKRITTPELNPGNAYTIWFTGLKEGFGNDAYNITVNRAQFLQ